MMNKARIVKLGETEYAVGPFTLGQVSRLAVILRQAAEIDTQPKADAQQTVIYMALQNNGYDGTYYDFLNLQDVTSKQLVDAQLEIGRSIGFYTELKAEQGSIEPATVMPSAPFG